MDDMAEGLAGFMLFFLFHMLCVVLGVAAVVASYAFVVKEASPERRLSDRQVWIFVGVILGLPVISYFVLDYVLALQIVNVAVLEAVVSVLAVVGAIFGSVTNAFRGRGWKLSLFFALFAAVLLALPYIMLYGSLL